MDKKDYTMITLSLALIVSLGFNVMPEPTHTCDSRELQAYCFDLSSTGITCYTLPNYAGGKRCSEGWNEINKINIQKEISAKQWLCSVDGCEIK